MSNIEILVPIMWMLTAISGRLYGAMRNDPFYFAPPGAIGAMSRILQWPSILMIFFSIYAIFSVFSVGVGILVFFAGGTAGFFFLMIFMVEGKGTHYFVHSTLASLINAAFVFGSL